MGLIWVRERYRVFVHDHHSTYFAQNPRPHDNAVLLQWPIFMYRIFNFMSKRKVNNKAKKKHKTKILVIRWAETPTLLSATSPPHQPNPPINHMFTYQATDWEKCVWVLSGSFYRLRIGKEKKRQQKKIDWIATYNNKSDDDNQPSSITKKWTINLLTIIIEKYPSKGWNEPQKKIILIIRFKI